MLCVKKIMSGELGLMFVALTVRLFLLWQDSQAWLGQRIEISTPVNQWMRIREGIALSENGLSPYSGDVFHETPLSLALFTTLYSLGQWAVGIFYIVIDFLVALCLARITALHQANELAAQSAERAGYGKGVEEILIKPDSSLPLFVAIVYLLNPYSILTCGSFSSISLTNLAVVMAVWMKLKGSDILSTLAVAIATYQSLYPVVLIFPFLLMSHKKSGIGGVFQHLSLVCSWGCLLLYLSFKMTGSWDFLFAVHGVILAVPDQTPNVGLFWYFFTETFEHFRVFFLCIFQINAFIYVIPLTIRFSHRPMFLCYVLLSLMALFKSYPCIGDLTVPLALLPLWSQTFRYLRYTLIVLVMFLVSSILCPVLWYLWIHAGSANANFFFSMTLTYSLAQIFLVADVIYSFMVYQYDLKHGLPRVDSHGRAVQLKLN